MIRLYHKVFFESPIPLIDIFGVNGATGKKAKKNPDICLTVSEMVGRINAAAEKIEKNEIMLAAIGGEKNIDKWKGDVFEGWVEFFIRSSPVDKRIGIYDYKINFGEDLGVDGVGKSLVDSTPATVQIKFRTNSTLLLTSDDRLPGFGWNSVTSFDVPPKSKNNLLVITTANGVHNVIKKMGNDTIRCLGYNELGKMVNKMRGFWEQFIGSIEYTKNVVEQSKKKD